MKDLFEPFQKREGRRGRGKWGKKLIARKLAKKKGTASCIRGNEPLSRGGEIACTTSLTQRKLIKRERENAFCLNKGRGKKNCRL